MEVAKITNRKSELNAKAWELYRMTLEIFLQSNMKLSPKADLEKHFEGFAAMSFMAAKSFYDTVDKFKE